MFFSPCTSFLFIKEEMPGVETLMFFVKKENARSLEVYALSNMKEVCQNVHMHLYIRTLKEKLFNRISLLLARVRKAVLTIGITLG